MKVLAVCGFGVGTSMVLKMNIQDVLEENDIQAKVETADSNTATSKKADIILTSKEVGEVLGETEAPKIIISDFMDIKEIENKLVSFIEEDYSQ